MIGHLMSKNAKDQKKDQRFQSDDDATLQVAEKAKDEKCDDE